MYKKYEQNTIDQRAKNFIADTNKVLRNTYLLLSMTLMFSALTASFSIVISAPMFNPILTLILYFVLLSGVQMKRNSPVGLILVFALTGFLGLTIGPIISYYANTFSNGPELVMMSLGMTGAIFLGLSITAIAYPNLDLTRMGNFLSVGSLVCLMGIVFNLFLKIPAVHLALSLIVAFISGGVILWNTNQVIQGGERNYITATVTLYVSIFNLFLTILQFLSIFLGKRD